MAVISISGVNVDSIVKIVTINAIASLWWNGTQKVPFATVDVDDPYSISYSGYYTAVDDNQLNPLPRHSFSNGVISVKDEPIEITRPNPYSAIQYYEISNNGCSMFIDKLLLINVTDLTGLLITCSFHTHKYDNVSKVVVKYEYEVIE